MTDTEKKQIDDMIERKYNMKTEEFFDYFHMSYEHILESVEIIKKKSQKAFEKMNWNDIVNYSHVKNIRKSNIDAPATWISLELAYGLKEYIYRDSKSFSYLYNKSNLEIKDILENALPLNKKEIEILNQKTWEETLRGIVDFLHSSYTEKPYLDKIFKMLDFQYEKINKTGTSLPKCFSDWMLKTVLSIYRLKDDFNSLVFNNVS